MFNRLNPWHERVPHSSPSELVVFGRKYMPDFVPGVGVGDVTVHTEYYTRTRKVR